VQSLGYRSTGAVDHPAPGSLALARDSTRRQEWAQYSAIGPNRRCVAGSFAFESQPAGSGVDLEPRYGFHYNGAKQALCPASRGPRLPDAWEMNTPGRPTVRGIYRTAGHQAARMNLLRDASPTANMLDTAVPMTPSAGWSGRAPRILFLARIDSRSRRARKARGDDTSSRWHLLPQRPVND